VRFEILGRTVAVLGGKPKVQPIEVLRLVAEIDSRHGTITQVFDAQKVAGREHLLHAAFLALLSEDRGERFANDPRLNLLCWVAAERQIGVALQKVGITAETKEVAVVVVGRSESSVASAVGEVSELLKRDDKVLSLSAKKRRNLLKIFSLPPVTERVEKLVLEKIALLELAK